MTNDEITRLKVIKDNAPITDKRLFERAIQDIERLKQIEQIYNDRLGKPIGHTLNEIWDVLKSEDNNAEVN